MQEFDPDLRIGGVLLNRVGGPAHTKWLQDAISSSGVSVPFLGGIPKVGRRSECCSPRGTAGRRPVGLESAVARRVCGECGCSLAGSGGLHQRCLEGRTVVAPAPAASRALH